MEQRRRTRILKRIRREEVTEMILEPIHGFHSDEYFLKLEITSNENEGVILAILQHIQNTMYSFFLEAANKASFFTKCEFDVETPR
jgi:hypothetical protein